MFATYGYYRTCAAGLLLAKLSVSMRILSSASRSNGCFEGTKAMLEIDISDELPAFRGNEA